MGNHQRSLRLRSGLKLDALTEIVKEVHPNFDKALLSKCENPEKYGVKLDYKTFRHLYESVDPEGWKKYKRHTDGHKNQFRIYCRMDAATYTELFWRVKEDGYKTMQDWVMNQIRNYIKEPRP